MFNLAIYNQTIEINYEQMKKYYLMAINNNCQDAKYNLELYNQSICRFNV